MSINNNKSVNISVSQLKSRDFNDQAAPGSL